MESPVATRGVDCMMERMPRPKSELTPFNLKLSKKEHQALRWFAQEEQRSMSEVIREYLRTLVKKYDAAQKKSQD
jgi:hypothetical protein